MRSEIRAGIYARCILAGFIFLAVGLVYTQIIRYGLYKKMSEENRLRVTPLMAPRGTIYDRNGKAMVKDDLCFNASVIYSQIKNRKDLVDTLVTVCNVPRGDVENGMNTAKRMPYTPTVVVPAIGVEGAIRVEEIKLDHPGLIVQVSTKRKYVGGKSGAAMLGYLGLMNSSEFGRLKHYGYQLNDLVGKTGVERYYDNYLRGRHGGKQVEVDSRGREVLALGYREPIPGNDIYLTVDADLQKFCDSIMAGKRGAIVAMDPRSGEILAMASSPSFDPEMFLDKKRRKEIKAMLKDPAYPLINRAIAAAYPPGSVFKLVVSAAGLETGKVGRNTTTVCNGIFHLGSSAFHCWKDGGHGAQNITQAIKNSCNLFFYRTGLMLGADNIADFAERFGFGQRTGVDLFPEEKGNVPSPKWKAKVLHEDWFMGETVNYAIGQGYLTVTPLQVARMAAVFANKGYLVRPYVAQKIGTVDVNAQEKISLQLSQATLEAVREGMKLCVNDPRGTGMKARMQGVIVSGKTGTAQTSKGINHGWFAGFAPFQDAQLVVVVFDEYGGRGGYYAAETAGRVFREAEKLGILKG